MISLALQFHIHSLTDAVAGGQEDSSVQRFLALKRTDGRAGRFFGPGPLGPPNKMNPFINQ